MNLDYSSIVRRSFSFSVLILSLWLCATAVADGVVLRVGSGTGGAGQDVEIPVELDAGSSPPATVFFDIEYTELLSVTSVEALGAAVSAAKTVSSSVVAPGRLRCIVGGMNENTMADGPLLLVTFTVANLEYEGTDVILSASLLSAAAPDATAIAVSAQDGLVCLQESQAIPSSNAFLLFFLASALATLSVLLLSRRTGGRRFLSLAILCVLLSLKASGAPLACDLDASGQVDGADLNLLIANVLEDPLPGRYDVDRSGETDAVDFQLVVRAALGDVVDSDGDGLTDAAEENLGTDPDLVDTDADGLEDGVEVLEAETDPLTDDTDGDGVSDGQEFAYGEDPLTANPEYVIIHEFVASNQDGLQDEDGDYSDWIELYNPGTNAVDLAGWTLSDDEDELDRWTFPAVTLPGGAYLVVFASDKDRRPTDGSNLHTNFKLGASGEFLALCNDAGAIQPHSVFDEYPEQRTDFSYGRYPLTPGFWYFDAPTPGAANDGGNKFRGFVEAVEFSVAHGFHDTPFELELSCGTAGAMIRYTLDGSVPSGTSGLIYTDAIAIDESTVVSASAYGVELVPSNITTHSYLFDASAEARGLPVVSLVGDEEATFYEPNGVMAIVGGYYDSSGYWQANGPEDYNHPMQHGNAYERPVSVEYIEPDGDGFQINGGLRVHGSDNTRQKYRRCEEWIDDPCRFSFRLYLRSEYGAAELDYPLFEDASVDQFERLVLRAGADARNIAIDEFARRLFGRMGQVTSHGSFVNVFINGDYKCASGFVERLDEQFFQTWFDSDEDWDVIDAGGAVRDGDIFAYDALIDLAQGSDLSDASAYQEISDRLDVTNFIDYLIVELYINNMDWIGNNYCAARERSATGKFRMHVWDVDYSMGVGMDDLSTMMNSNGLYRYPVWSPGGGTGLNGESYDLAVLYRALKENAEFRERFSERIHTHFFNDGALTNANLTETFEEIRLALLEVAPEMSSFITDVYIPNRREPLLRSFSEEGLLELEPPEVGIEEDAMILSSPVEDGVIYYTLDGSDPRSAQNDVTLVPEAAAKRLHVPLDNAPLYSSGPFAVTRLVTNVDITDLSKVQDVLLDSSLIESKDVGEAAVVNFSNTGTDGHFGDNLPFPGLTLNDNADEFLVTVSGTCLIPSAGEWTFGVNSDDGFALVLQEVHDASLIQWEVRDPADSFMTVDIPQAGEYELFLVYFEFDGGAELELFAAQGAHSAFNASFHLVGDTASGGLEIVTDWPDVEFDDSAWIAGTGGVGFETETSSYDSVIGMDIEAQMHGQNSGCYVRIPFTIDAPDLEQLKFLTLNARYNDGFVVYLNGEEVARANAPEALDWDAVATDTHGGLDAADPVSFHIPHGLASLRAGENVLSLHGLNVDASDADFLISVELLGRTETAAASGAIAYTGAVPFSGTVAVRARVFADGLWSPLLEETLSVGTIPEPGAVVINEALAHSPDAQPDWIELHNTTHEPIDIGGWFLSDDGDDLRKYEIASGVVLSAQDYLVFSEDVHFGNTDDPGCHTPFALSENGEDVYVSSGHDGGLTGYTSEVELGASESGVAIGRYLKSTGTYDFVAMSANTPGAANAYPKVGPIVINELMYDPPSGDQNEEYIELYNLSAEPVALYDSEGTPWKFTDGIDFAFPEGTSIPGGGYLLLVKDIDEFNARYPGTPGGVQVLGPYEGNLSNGGEELELALPGDLDGEGARVYIRADNVDYDDAAPWPESPDGNGDALTRKAPAEYGDDVANWIGAEPTPGAP